MTRKFSRPSCHQACCSCRRSAASAITGPKNTDDADIVTGAEVFVENLSSPAAALDARQPGPAFTRPLPAPRDRAVVLLRDPGSCSARHRAGVDRPVEFAAVGPCPSSSPSSFSSHPRFVRAGIGRGRCGFIGRAVVVVSAGLSAGAGGCRRGRAAAAPAAAAGRGRILAEATPAPRETIATAVAMKQSFSCNAPLVPEPQ